MPHERKNWCPSYPFLLVIVGGIFGCGGVESVSSNGSAGGGTSIGGTGSGGVSLAGGAMSTGGAYSTGGTTGACTDPDATGFANKIASTTVGTNGSFSDHCDSSGNLVEYYCESAPCTTGPYPVATTSRIAIPICRPQLTGQVLSTTVNCGGKCDAGRCFQWCPSQGDKIAVTAVGTSSINISFTGYSLTCSVVFTQTGFNCLDNSIAGTTLAVVSTGNCDTTTSVFGVALPNSSGAEACAYQCTVVN